MITIYYFGIIRETVKTETEKMAYTGPMNTDDLLEELRSRNPEWRDVLAPHKIFRLAVNHKMIFEAASLQDGDEIAILPPVTGG